MYRRLFGVPDVITDMMRSLEMVETKRLIYWKPMFGYGSVPSEIGIYRSTGRLPEPPGA